MISKYKASSTVIISTIITKISTIDAWIQLLPKEASAGEKHNLIEMILETLCCIQNGQTFNYVTMLGLVLRDISVTLSRTRLSVKKYTILYLNTYVISGNIHV